MENPDLVITQSAATIVKTTQGIQPLAEVMQNDVLRISAAEKLAACGERFPL